MEQDPHNQFYEAVDRVFTLLPDRYNRAELEALQPVVGIVMRAVHDGDYTYTQGFEILNNFINHAHESGTYTHAD